jgi:protein-disulfide isomerase
MRQIWLVATAFVAATCVLGPLRAGAQESGPTVSDGDRVLGKPDAPITIIEYGSLTCPHCAEFDQKTFPTLKSSWIDTGKAKLVFRVFPLNNVDVGAAVVASCVPPERYYDFIDAVYKSQDTWSRAANPVQAVATIARLGGGLSDDKIKSCLADQALQKSIVDQAYATSKSYGVESTPTFFINGAKMDPNGAQPFEVFDKALTAAQPKT